MALLLLQILRYVIAWGGLLLLSATFACQGQLPSPTQTPMLDARSILEDSGKAMALLESFGFDLTHRNGGMHISDDLVLKDVSGNVVKPDKIKISWGGSFSGFYVSSQVISLDEQTYMTDPITGRWSPMPTDLNPLVFFNPDLGIASVMSDVVEASVAGLETLGEVTMYRIEGRLPTGSLKPLLGDVATDLMVDTMAWIGSTDMHLHKVIFSGVVAPGDAIDIKRTIKLFDFNQPVVIDAPRLE